MTDHVVLAAIGLVILLTSSCDAFVARPEHVALISTELGLKTTGMQFYYYLFCFIFVGVVTASNNLLLFVALLYVVLSHRVVPKRISFNNRSNESENGDHSTADEFVYHRRIVHFELDHEKAHKQIDQIDTRKYRTDASPDRTRHFEWADHRSFAQTFDP